MNFSKFYKKLAKSNFSTIRRSGHWKAGEFESILVDRKYIYTAHIYTMNRQALNDLPGEFLMKDTDTENRAQAYKYIQNLYTKQIDQIKEKMFVYFLRPYYSIEKKIRFRNLPNSMYPKSIWEFMEIDEFLEQYFPHFF